MTENLKQILFTTHQLQLRLHVDVLAEACFTKIDLDFDIDQTISQTLDSLNSSIASRKLYKKYLSFCYSDKIMCVLSEDCP